MSKDICQATAESRKCGWGEEPHRTSATKQMSFENVALRHARSSRLANQSFDAVCRLARWRACGGGAKGCVRSAMATVATAALGDLQAGAFADVCAVQPDDLALIVAVLADLLPPELLRVSRFGDRTALRSSSSFSVISSGRKPDAIGSSAASGMSPAAVLDGRADALRDELHRERPEGLPHHSGSGRTLLCPGSPDSGTIGRAPGAPRRPWAIRAAEGRQVRDRVGVAIDTGNSYDTGVPDGHLQTAISRDFQVWLGDQMRLRGLIWAERAKRRKRDQTSDAPIGHSMDSASLWWVRRGERR